jgi:stage IV sporulation protein FB
LILFSKTVLIWNKSFLVNIGILLCINFIYLSTFSEFSLTNTEILIISITNLILLIASLAIHDVGHLIGALIERININKIIFSCFGGLIIFDKNNHINLKSMIILFLSGPLTNIIISICLLMLWQYHNQFAGGTFPIKEALEKSLYLLFVYNFSLGFINLIPILPFDGGNLVYLNLCKKFQDRKKQPIELFFYINEVFYVMCIILILVIILISSQYTMLILIIYLIILYNDFKSISKISNS